VIGKTLGHHRILAKIGAGGMGEVYRARDEKLGRDVALKILPPELASDPERRARFEREAKAVAALNHPGVVTIHSIEEADSIHFLTMEIVEGANLSERIPLGGLALAEFFAIAVPLLDAVGAAHEKGIVHRDLKPDNVRLTRSGEVKVLDFGLAKLAENPAAREMSQVLTQPVTQEGRVMGTAPYMSPEQAQGLAVDHRSDIFSLGTVLYEMASGQRPFRGTTALELGSAILRDSPAPLLDLNPALPEHLGRIIRRCLEKDPRRRFQTALDVKTELEDLRDEISGVVRGAPSTASASGASSALRASSSAHLPLVPARRSRVWIPLAAGAVLAVVAVVFVARGRNAGTDARRATSGAGSARAGAAQPSAAARTSSDLPATTPDRKMIVVLPFENLGTPDDAYFAAGMTEEFTSRLAKVRGLGVISRTSAVQYDRAGKTLRQIGADLGVDYVLEGTVRWDRSSGDRGAGASRVRVTPQLIRVSDDTHLWSEQYDRTIDDLFAVQSEIATNVIKSLGVTLLEPEQRAIAARPTENMDAYHAYLRGIDDLESPDYSEARMRRTSAALEQAVALDSTFALAWAALSQNHSRIHHFGYDQSPERTRSAGAAAERALALQPDLPEAQLAFGYYHYWCFRDYPRALAAFAEAEKGLPNDTRVIAGVAYILRRQGRLEDAIAQIERAIEISPQEARLSLHQGETYGWLRRFDEADPYLDRSIVLDPDQTQGHAFKAFGRWGRGDLAAARTVLTSMPRSDANHETMYWWMQGIFERRYDDALAVLASSPLSAIEDQFQYLPKALLEAEALRLKGDSAGAKAAFAVARDSLEHELRERPDDHRVHSSLGVAYAGLGLREEAVREGGRGYEAYPPSKDALIGPFRVADLALIHTMLGDKDAALDALEQLAAGPSGQVLFLQVDPRWDSLRGEPRFAKLSERVAPVEVTSHRLTDN